MAELNMNLDLKNAYENAVKLANTHADISIDLLKDFSALVMIVLPELYCNSYTIYPRFR